MSPRAPKGWSSPIWRAPWRRRPKPPAVSLAVVCRDGPRMQQLARALEFFAPDLPVMQFPAWDCQPYDRVSPHGGILAQRLTTLARLSRLEGQRQAADRADHGQRHRAAGAGARNRRGAGAVGRARPCRADGLHRRLAGAQRLQPLLDRARARRICRARRHPRSVSGRARPAGAVRFLRRQPGIDPHLRCRNPAHAARHARARSGADLGIPAGHRNHPPLPHGLCRDLRRAGARRSAVRGGQRRPPPSRHGALAAAVPGADGHAVRLSRRRAGRDRAAGRGRRARALQADRGLLRGAARGDGASRRRRDLQAVAAGPALSDRRRMDASGWTRPRWRG